MEYTTKLKIVLTVIGLISILGLSVAVLLIGK